MDSFDALRLLVRIADTGRLTAAARQQSVATSTVTLALQQLEEQLQTRLINRTTRKYVQVTGNRSANDSAVLRHWTMKGYGIMLKHRWEIKRELEQNLLSTALDDYALPHVDLHAVTSSGPCSKRVTALIDFLADQMRLS
ncbi:LysR family transcriptional regulator [Pseudomonas sp. TMB3-21]